MRALYEGYAEALSRYLSMPLPPWFADQPHKDNWLTVAKLRTQAETANLAMPGGGAPRDDLAGKISALTDHPHDF